MQQLEKFLLSIKFSENSELLKNEEYSDSFGIVDVSTSFKKELANLSSVMKHPSRFDLFISLLIYYYYYFFLI